MTTTHHAHVVWRGGRDDLRAHAVRVAEQELACSCAPELGGDATKADPEELLVASLSSCHMLWFLDYARRARLRVRSYEDEPEGTMDGIRFTRVVLRPRVGFEREADDDIVANLHHRAHESCFIASSVSFPVDVEQR